MMLWLFIIFLSWIWWVCCMYLVVSWWVCWFLLLMLLCFMIRMSGKLGGCYWRSFCSVFGFGWSIFLWCGMVGLGCLLLVIRINWLFFSRVMCGFCWKCCNSFLFIFLSWSWLVGSLWVWLLMNWCVCCW